MPLYDGRKVRKAAFNRNVSLTSAESVCSAGWSYGFAGNDDCGVRRGGVGRSPHCRAAGELGRKPAACWAR